MTKSVVVRVVSQPSIEPVTLAHARRWVKAEEDETTHDVELALLIAAARRYAENLTGRAFIQRPLQLVLPDWQGGCIELPHPPLYRVTGITYVDTDGVTQTLAADQYVVHDYREPAVVVPAWEVTWPAIRAVMDAVRVDYIAGYAGPGSPNDPDSQRAGVPENLKLWMQARLATMFEIREQVIVGGAVAALARHHVDGLLDDLVLADRVVG